MTVDKATDAVAGAAITSPLWYHWLEQVSTWAALVLPILGCIWLAVQIYSKWREEE